MDDLVVSINLKTSEWNVVMNALAGRPYGEVASLINEIRKQADTQLSTQPPSETE